MKNQKFEEAILHYTYAIKLDPSNYTLHSNRSYAFLKVQQYYFALEDANETIRLNPSWPKVRIEFLLKDEIDVIVLVLGIFSERRSGVCSWSL